MANRYLVEASKSRTNYMDGRGSGPVVVDTILERGDVTVNAKNTLSYGGHVLGMPSETFAINPDLDIVNRGDYFVQLAVDVAYTYEALQGHPIVTSISTTGGVAGTLLTFEGSLMAKPATTLAANSVAKRVAGKFYQVEAVKLFGFDYRAVKVDGTNPIAVGDALTYDVSADKWIKDNDGTAVISCHYAAADNLYVGALFAPTFAVSQA